MRYILSRNCYVMCFLLCKKELFLFILRKADLMIRLLPYVHPYVEQVLRHKDRLLEVARLHKGSIHLISPEIFRENIASIKAVFHETRDYVTTSSNSGKKTGVNKVPV